MAMISLLSFCSTINILTPIIDMTTNSVKYYGMGKYETLSIKGKAQNKNNATKVILGDSVADQLYAYRDNDEYCILSGNMAMTHIWQYLFVREYIEENLQTTDIYLCMTPDGFEHSFETNLSYAYMLIPLAESGNMEVLEEEQVELLKNMYGSIFVSPKVVNFIGEEHIQRVMFDRKTVTREFDRMMGFTRFAELKDGSLFARIGPKCNLVPLLAGHFADRFPGERWTIYDENRHLMAYHIPNMGWNLMKGDLSRYLPDDSLSEEQEDMEVYWKTFFETIAIEARKNPRCQQQMLPKYYRKYFSKSGDKTFD